MIQLKNKKKATDSSNRSLFLELWEVIMQIRKEALPDYDTVYRVV
ncbi:hypothetical protein U1544_07275 [Enterococcus cecorum]|nr:hypothetical protein [Enterococcus cecorum]